jgi:NhaP-type Na+/H+ or K+/H+ antiporter
MTYAKKRHLVADVRERIVGLCAFAGFVLAAVWVVDHPVTAPECSTGATTCATDVISQTIQSFVFVCGGGLLAGTLLGVVLAMLIPAPRRPVAPSHRATGAPLAHPAGRWLTARYAGSCAACRAAVAPGDRIRHRPGHTLCEPCGAPRPCSPGPARQLLPME